MDAYGLSDRGLKRDTNQDTILIDLPRALFIVADGMGGHKGGGVASQVAVESFSRYVYASSLMGPGRGGCVRVGEGPTETAAATAAAESAVESGLTAAADSADGARPSATPPATAVASATPPAAAVASATPPAAADSAAGARPSATPPQILTEAFTQASYDVYQKSLADDLRGMGTTLVSAWFVGGLLYVGYVGDSRAYLFKDDQLWQMTEDHSLENEKRRLGLPEGAARENKKNIITRCVGFQEDVVCDVIERDCAAGDILLLCSDGLSGAVSDAQIQDLCRQHRGDLKLLVEGAVAAANTAGGLDNVSVVAIKI